MNPEIRTLSVGALTRVEGEGALHVTLSDSVVESVELNIYEPPRFFEAFLRGRAYTEPPDITARVCGICPVAYQISASNAIEDACGVTVPPELVALRRLLYCGIDGTNRRAGHTSDQRAAGSFYSVPQARPRTADRDAAPLARRRPRHPAVGSRIRLPGCRIQPRAAFVGRRGAVSHRERHDQAQRRTVLRRGPVQRPHHRGAGQTLHRAARHTGRRAISDRPAGPVLAQLGRVVPYRS